MSTYELGEKIGRGGMGVVYRAQHTGLDIDVAVKFIHPHLADDDEAVARFIREARLSARIKHPNIVQIYDTGRDEQGRAYIVMEYLEGQSLRQRLKNGPIPEVEAIKIANDVLAALGKAHSTGVIHRDIKPGNIFLCSDGVAKLVDFGIAKAVGGGTLTGTGALVGTPEYMSPEQAEGLPVDAKTDIYSLGIVMYEMLTGVVPFKADSPLVVLRMQSERAFPPLSSSISEPARRFVEGCLQKDPEVRTCRRPLESPAPSPSEGPRPGSYSDKKHESQFRRQLAALATSVTALRKFMTYSKKPPRIMLVPLVVGLFIVFAIILCEAFRGL